MVNSMLFFFCGGAGCHAGAPCTGCAKLPCAVCGLTPCTGCAKLPCAACGLTPCTGCVKPPCAACIGCIFCRRNSPLSIRCWYTFQVRFTSCCAYSAETMRFRYCPKRVFKYSVYCLSADIDMIYKIWFSSLSCTISQSPFSFRPRYPSEPSAGKYTGPIYSLIYILYLLCSFTLHFTTSRTPFST